MSTVFIHSENVRFQMPTYATPGAAGFDLFCVDNVIIFDGDTKLVRLGFSCEIPNGTFMMLAMRSGLSLKHGLMLANGVGIIDQDYRGEVGAIIHNAGRDPFKCPVGTRLCQGILVPFLPATFVEVPTLEETVRGEGGFGSTGLN